ncbi:MAG: cyclase family protein [Burkholderiaceae bacterium]|nr:cyclase family protein [Burkholderiaceae bacterium]MCD8516410.1 cyclase family protein [Burkholderiaceae bacterium]MCD8536841.1 cyclase family protein [Burkholderiaceae bacterium]MCD8565487.1 cyclase family protein [Burkholderiaceae bacterium]
MGQRWKKRPEGSNWGDFGADDQIGRLNLLTPEKVRLAAQEIQAGRTFSLSLPLDFPGGNVMNENRYPPILRPNLRHGDVNMNYVFSQRNSHSHDVFCDDLAILHLQYSTQWDSLCHVGALFDVNDDGQPVPVYYNGFRAGEHIVAPESADDCGIKDHMPAHSTSRVTALGIENMAATGVQGRGVMVDLRKHFGDKRVAVTYAMLEHILRVDDITVEQGDMLCFHTGLSDLILQMNKNPDLKVLNSSCAVLDGSDIALQNWIRDCGISVIATDNYAVEDYPAELPNKHCSVLPLHHLCLFKLGIHLGELWHFTPLANWLNEHHRYRFFLTAPPLRLPGAVGSPVSPVATV